MDPVTIGAVLAAIAGGAEGALGAQAWAGACALVRRPFRRGHPAAEAGASSGVTELAAVQQDPGAPDRAVALAEVLLARAAVDSGFGQALRDWWAQASQIEVSGNAASTITGGTFHGPVVQGRDFTNLTFTSSPAPPPRPAPPDDSP